MFQRPSGTTFAHAGDRNRGTDTDRAELAAFFRELGLGWEVDAERLIDRITDPRGER